MHYLYIIYSKSSDKYYVGETTNLTKRIYQHNSHTFKGSFTKIASDWEVVLKFSLKNRENATYLEKFIKRMKSRKFIHKIIQDPEILMSILKNR